MRGQLQPSTQDFIEEITRFVEQYWPIDRDHVSAKQLESWHDALVNKGWSVPDWPRHAGGPGWSPTQRYCWHKVCIEHGVGDNYFEDAGVGVIGPMLFESDKASMVDRWLDGMRRLQDRWCLGVAEQHCGLDSDAMHASALPCDAGYRLSGSKVWVADAAAANWMGFVAQVGDASKEARQLGMFAVEMAHPGVVVTPVQALDGSTNLSQVQLEDVIVPSQNLLIETLHHHQLQQLVRSSVMASVSRGVVAAAQLAQLDAHMHDLAEDDPLYTKRHAVAVELSALQAMELRYLDALERDVQIPFGLDVLRIKSRAILLQLGALQMECFGYYALPYPDEVLTHNEGPIGPKGAVTAMRAGLAQQVAQLYEGSAEAMKDQIAGDLNIVVTDTTMNS